MKVGFELGNETFFEFFSESYRNGSSKIRWEENKAIACTPRIHLEDNVSNAVHYQYPIQSLAIEA